MAEGKDNSEPDFSDFEDWRKDSWWDIPREQGNIINRNIALLLDRGAWEIKVKKFEEELKKITNKNEREEERGEFEIHFDNHELSSEEIKGLDRELNFSNYLFPCAVSFESMKFPDIAVSFMEAIFKNDVDFTQAGFKRGISFAWAIFNNGYVNFSGTDFGRGRVSFAGVEFSKEPIEFTGSIFKGDVSFEEAEFADSFRFTPDKEKSKIQSASFNDMKVAGNLTINADFYKVATFRRLDIKGSADFSGSSFKTVPDFRDMKLDRPPEVAGMEVPPEKLKMGFWPFAKYSGDKDDVAKYRNLKSMAIVASDHVKGGEFFA
ncbi:MAG: hypothetical protein L3J15_02755, partial [Devosiaceae bacterium]|nr:hypothetical protein [Devosiaceae bacterium]